MTRLPMTVPSILTYLLIASYFIIERLRQGSQALSLETGQYDRCSSQILWGTGLINLFLLILAPLLNHHGFGYWSTSMLSWLGILFMLIGLILRSIAAATLGRFYTRTLQVSEAHQLVGQGPYQWIRHPGYLGLIMVDVGAGLALQNWVVLLFISLSGLLSRLFRIHVEEEMLREVFGEAYQDDIQGTWRLLPFVY